MEIVDPFETTPEQTLVEEKQTLPINDPFESSGIIDPFDLPEKEKEQIVGDFPTRVFKGLTEANTFTHGDYTPEKALISSWVEDFKTTKDLITGKYDYSKLNPIEIVSHMPIKTLHEIGAIANAFVAAPWAVANASVDLLLKQSPSSARKIYDSAFKDATWVDPESHGVKVAFDLIGKTINTAISPIAVTFAEADKAWTERTGKKMSAKDYNDVIQGTEFLGNMVAIIAPFAKFSKDAYINKTGKIKSSRDTIDSLGEEFDKQELRTQEELPFVNARPRTKQPDLFEDPPARDLDKTSNQGELFLNEPRLTEPVTSEKDLLDEMMISEGRPPIGDRFSSLPESLQTKLSSLREEINKDYEIKKSPKSTKEQVAYEEVGKEYGITEQRISERTVGELDPLYNDAVASVTKLGRASVSTLRREFGLSGDRAERLIGEMEKQGVVTTELVNGSRNVISEIPHPMGGVGKSQGGAIDLFGKREKKIKSLEEKVDSLSKVDWIKEFKLKYPDATPEKIEYIYNRLKPATPVEVNTGIRSIKQQFGEKVKDWDGQGKADERAIMQGEVLLERVEPDKAKREGLYDVIDQGTDNNHPFVKTYRSLADSVWEEANKAGVVSSYLENYISHMYDFGKQASSQAVKVLLGIVDSAGRTIGSGMSPRSQFARERTFKTIQDAAEKMGLTPLTKDPAQVFNLYATSMLKAVNNKKLIKELKEIKDPETGRGMIIQTPKQGEPVPKDYVSINHPQFIGMLVHKSIADSMSSMFDAYRPMAITRTALAIDAFAKTAKFSFSGFHIKSLGDALLGAVRSLSAITQLKSLFKEWKEGGAGDIVDIGIRGGLELGKTPLDLNPSLVRAIANDAAKGMDKLVPGLGGTIRLPLWLSEKLVHYTFHVAAPAFKLSIFSQEYGRMVGKGIEPKLAAEMAATFANDLFGALSWRRLAIDAETTVGEGLANAIASKRGQAYAKLAVKAPDWTIATARTWLGAIKKGTHPEQKLMYAKYLTQSALLYATIADAINLQTVGRHFWENEDPTTVDLGDGRRVQLSKHFMEGIHWLTDPDKALNNKLGFLASEFESQRTNKKYLSGGGAPDIVPKRTKRDRILNPENAATTRLKNTGKRALHVAEMFAPITMLSAIENSPETAVAGFSGFQVLGKTPEQKQEEKLKRMMNGL